VLRFYGAGGPFRAAPPLPVVPSIRSSGVAFRAYGLVGSRDYHISGSDSAARVLAVYASQSGLPRHHARLASGCGPALLDGLQPLATLLVFCNVDGHMASSVSEISWRTVGGASGLGAKVEGHRTPIIGRRRSDTQAVAAVELARGAPHADAADSSRTPSQDRPAHRFREGTGSLTGSVLQVSTIRLLNELLKIHAASVNSQCPRRFYPADA